MAENTSDNLRGKYFCEEKPIFYKGSIGNYKGVMLCSRPNEDLYIHKEKFEAVIKKFLTVFF